MLNFEKIFKKNKWKKETCFGKIEWFAYDKDKNLLGSIESDFGYEASMFLAKNTWVKTAFIDRIKHEKK